VPNLGLFALADVVVEEFVLVVEVIDGAETGARHGAHLWMKVAPWTTAASARQIGANSGQSTLRAVMVRLRWED
jgi:hypothetical protein